MKKPFSMKKFVRYLSSFMGYITLTLADGKFSPFSLSLLTANLFVGLKPFTSFILYLLPFFISLDFMTVLSAGVGGGIISLCFYFYRSKNKTPSFEITFLLCLALCPFVLFTKSRSLPFRIIISCGIIILSFVITQGARVWLVKGLKYKLSQTEIISSSVLVFICGYGAIIAFGEGFCFAIALLAICFSTLFLKDSTPLLTALVCSLPFCLKTFSIEPIALFILISALISALNVYGRLPSAIGGTACIAVFFFTSNFFARFTPFDFLPTAVVLLCYLFVSDCFTEKVKTKLKIHTENNLGRYSVNKTRSALSGKLFEMAAVFDEMSVSMTKLKKESDFDEIKGALRDDIVLSNCSTCPEFLKCRSTDFPDNETLEKLIDLGFAKDGLSPSDLPKTFLKKCKDPSTVLNAINEGIEKLVKKRLYGEAYEESMDLIERQTKGVSDALKSIASKTGRQLELIPQTERKIYDSLLKSGIIVKELAFFKGEEEELNIVMDSDEVFSPVFLPSIEEILGYKSVIADITSLSSDLSAVTVKKRPRYDAAFGIASKAKQSKQKSGDTHSVTKLSEGKFLVALSDGMGSGERAEETSSTAISLVETFYKAGINPEIILSTVNKILTFSKEDDFTAMDVSVVNLFDGSVDFIKIGSPFSFIITRDSVKIIEGNSLPLGILDEMKPTVCSSSIKNGDVLVFLSDGITDSFSSSSDLIDFLSTQRALNPKTLADNLLERALLINDGKAIDDMTVFCVRIFERTDEEKAV